MKFYDKLFRFNYYKGVKEEFLDLYITEIDDMNSELEMFLIKESYLDIENILFFDIYFRELISIGILDNSSEKFFPDIHYESEEMYKDLDIFYEMLNLNSRFCLDKNESEEFIDNRNDSLKELAKIYYYMFPIINYGVYFSGVFIDQTFLIAYEFDYNRNIINEELYFSFPKADFEESKGLNFNISHGYINPMINKSHHENSELINNSYYKENYFKKQDWDFRNNVNLNEESFFDISFSHLNYELNGNITKSLLLTLQLNVNRNDKHFMINLIISLEQMSYYDEEIEYTTFIIKNNSQTYDWINSKYSDNQTFVISQQEFTEYSLTSVDDNYFHYGLFDKNYNFFQNGVSFDSFNLDLLSDPIKNFNSVNEYNYDLKYLSTLFLYSKLFQNINNSHYKKDGEEISLYIFSDEEKVKNICSQINFTKYIEYIKSDKQINCWDAENMLYYSEDDYKNAALFDSYTSIPYCACLPLYCLNNFKILKDEDYNYNEDNIVTKINLPDKCQNKFNYYLNEYEPKFIESYMKTISKQIFYLFNTDAKAPENLYIKIQKENFIQLPGYYLLSFSDIYSNTISLFYLFYNTINKTEIIVIILIILLFSFIITIVIIYKNLKKYSLIIEEFTQKYEKFVYHSKCSDIDILNQEDNRNNNNFDIKMYKQNNHDDFLSFLQNDNSLIYNNENTLIEDLFSIFCKYYNIRNKQLEKYY